MLFNLHLYTEIINLEHFLPFLIIFHYLLLEHFLIGENVSLPLGNCLILTDPNFFSNLNNKRSAYENIINKYLSSSY